MDNLTASENQSAKSHHGHRVTTVEIVISGRFNEAMPLYRGVLRYARERGGWRVFVRNTYEPRLYQTGLLAEPDGILAVCPYETTRDELLRQNKPVVTFYADVPHAVFPTVAMDEEAIGRVAAEHLMSQGFGSFAFLGTDEPYALQREKGFSDAIIKAGHPRPQLMTGTGTLHRPKTTEIDAPRIRRWLTSLRRPIGIMAQSDAFSAEIVTAALAAGLSVPQFCAVVGVDDDEVVCESSPITLSSVRTNLPGVAYAAARMLDQLLCGEKPPATPPVIAPQGIVVRASTDVLAFEDPDIRQAVRFIRDHACEGISVDDVVDAVAVSMRSLQYKFERIRRCRLSDEIRQVKLARAAALLRETRLSLREVARCSGFTSLAELCRQFKKHVGRTLQDYRQSNQGWIGPTT